MFRIEVDAIAVDAQSSAVDDDDDDNKTSVAAAAAAAAVAAAAADAAVDAAAVDAAAVDAAAVAADAVAAVAAAATAVDVADVDVPPPAPDAAAADLAEWVYCVQSGDDDAGCHGAMRMLAKQMNLRVKARAAEARQDAASTALIEKQNRPWNCGARTRAKGNFPE